jgi:hypothetical protein
MSGWRAPDERLPAGDKAFCAGGDLKAAFAGELVDASPAEMAAHDRGERPGVLGPSRSTDIYKPTIAVRRNHDESFGCRGHPGADVSGV